MLSEVDKRMTAQDIVGQIKNGDTVGIGGWSIDRKPMALVREIARSDLKDLTVIALGGLDLDMLIGTGKVKKAVYPFCVFEGVAGQPYNFRRSRQEASIEFMELSEQMTWHGLQAAADRMPFYPTVSGLGSDVLTMSPQIKVIESPYGPGKFVAVPPLNMDIALIQVNAADQAGNALILGNPWFDRLYARAAKNTFLCANKVVPRQELQKNISEVVISQMWVTGVAEAPYGAHPAACYPDYDWDTQHILDYSAAARDPKSFQAYVDKYVKSPKTQMDYVDLVGGKAKFDKLKI